MGRIVIRNGIASRTIPADDFTGEIEIDLCGETNHVRVPADVAVEVSD